MNLITIAEETVPYDDSSHSATAHTDNHTATVHYGEDSDRHSSLFSSLRQHESEEPRQYFVQLQVSANRCTEIC